MYTLIRNNTGLLSLFDFHNVAIENECLKKLLRFVLTPHFHIGQMQNLHLVADLWIKLFHTNRTWQTTHLC